MTFGFAAPNQPEPDQPQPRSAATGLLARPGLAIRPWRSEQATSFHAEAVEGFVGRSISDLDDELHALVAMQEAHVDQQCITLYAGTNVPNPRAARLLGSSIGSRPNLGPPGDTYNRGMNAASRLEVLCDELLGALFGAQFVETRVGSGSLANMYVYLATCKAGDQIMAFSDDAAGHVTHHRDGAAGWLGLTTHNIAFDSATMDIDIEAFANQVAQIRPTLIIVAGSMCLFPYNVRRVREIADSAGATVLFDAAHMGGMIAGGRFQSPLAEGAHVVTGSTYKSFGGPPSGMILTNDAKIAERLDAIAYPGFTANFDLSKTAALTLAVQDMHTYGQSYANACIENAQALASGLSANGVPVFEVPGRADHPDLHGRRPFTVSQHVAVEATTFGGGNRAAVALEQANILCSSIGLPQELVGSVTGDANGIRLGTQEVTRWGMTTKDMETIAEFFARVILGQVPAEIMRADVAKFRSQFQSVHFVRSSR